MQKSFAGCRPPHGKYPQIKPLTFHRGFPPNFEMTTQKMRATRTAKLLNAALAAACCVLFAAITSCGNRPAKTEMPVAVNGVLDLTGWDFENSGCVRLNGEWEFYWNRLLSPQDFRRGDAPAITGYYKIPGAWNGYEIGKTKLSGRDTAPTACLSDSIKAI